MIMLIFSKEKKIKLNIEKLKVQVLCQISFR